MSLIVGLFTALNSTGGVQRAGRHVAAVTAKYVSDHGFTYRFLSLNDPQGLHKVRVGSIEFSFTGHAGDKAHFVFAALRAAGRKPSLVIALHPHLAPVVWAMKIRSRDVGSMVFAHGIEVWQPLGWVRRAALHRADLAIGPSEDTIRHLISTQDVRAEIVQRLPWGLDPEFEARLADHAQPSLPSGFPLGGKIILAVGRWDPAERYKGADTLISALPRVLRTAPDTFLVLVGDGTDRPRLEHLARDSGVSERTRFLPIITKEELFACYAACNVFALPSSGEGFGLVFLEAMAHGKPVIGGAHGGIPDVVVDGVTGLLVPHGEVERLSSALELLLSNQAQAAAMGAAGRDRVAREFTFEQFSTRASRLMDDVLLRKTW
jgi:phosphatidylinositol alpha-1,6-mannosyltransferase